MLKTIAEVHPELVDFIEALDLPLSKPQKHHITQVADALVTTDGSKTLSALYRNVVGDPCPKAAADTFRETPWSADDLRTPLRELLVQEAFAIAEAGSAPRLAFLSLDDSLTDKDNGSRRLQLVDWHFDHRRSFSASTRRRAHHA